MARFSLWLESTRDPIDEFALVGAFPEIQQGILRGSDGGTAEVTATPKGAERAERFFVKWQLMRED